MHFDVRAEENEEHGHFITGQAIVYDSETDIGEFREIIEKGALEGTDLKDVPFFLNHNIDGLPYARSRNNNENSTLQLIPNEEGMAIRADLDIENNQDSSALYSAGKRGDIDGFSFMFEVGDEEWEDGTKPLRRIKTIKKVWEISAVVFPAYEDTELEARSKAEVLDSARQLLDSRKEKAERKAEMLKKLKEARKR